MRTIVVWSIVLVMAVVAAPPAGAATWTVGPGGPGSLRITGVSGNATIGTQFVCQGSTISGYASLGSGQSGAGLLTFTGSTWTGCAGPAGITLAVTHVGSWVFTATAHGLGVTTGTLTGVSLRMSGPLCSFSLTGSTPARYTNPTSPSGNGIFAVGSALTPPLRVSGVSGCLGLVRNGELMAINATYRMSPPFWITTP